MGGGSRMRARRAQERQAASSGAAAAPPQMEGLPHTAAAPAAANPGAATALGGGGGRGGFEGLWATFVPDFLSFLDVEFARLAALRAAHGGDIVPFHAGLVFAGELAGRLSDAWGDHCAGGPCRVGKFVERVAVLLPRTVAPSHVRGKILEGACALEVLMAEDLVVAPQRLRGAPPSGQGQLVHRDAARMGVVLRTRLLPPRAGGQGQEARPGKLVASVVYLPGVGAFPADLYAAAGKSVVAHVGPATAERLPQSARVLFALRNGWKRERGVARVSVAEMWPVPPG
ncbi:unnamed protein product [Prorocentrum cordatum]|uniref:Uncharacterized protein n=1 Tax=Prorocentrum cordatum TaxID=2364126 RepID=A0ABN9S4W0_9DINO|nr:unnamed protein product [Polarella glacialis]